MIEKKTIKYYFSTEGQTEKWYLEYLENLINSEESCNFKISFNIKVDNPSSYIKRLNILKETKIYHIFDVESSEEEYEKKFTSILNEMEKSEKLGKKISYINGYSNLTFELWILLHKTDMNETVGNRKNYLNKLNKFFNTKYKSLSEYKEEKHFKAILRQISLMDVKNATKRAEKIMNTNIKNGYKEINFGKYKWYRENPSTELGNIVKEILTKCGIL